MVASAYVVIDAFAVAYVAVALELVVLVSVAFAVAGVVDPSVIDIVCYLEYVVHDVGYVVVVFAYVAFGGQYEPSLP